MALLMAVAAAVAVLGSGECHFRYENGESFWLLDFDDPRSDADPDDSFGDCALQPFYDDPLELFPELHTLLHNAAALAKEAAELRPAEIPWPEAELYAGKEWKVVPLVHTFPALDVSQRSWLAATAAAPRTTELLRSMPRLRTALFSRLAPNTTLNAHVGWGSLANHVLRVHLPLAVPPGDHCGVTVVDETRLHREHALLCFDDSLPHFAFNTHPSASRTVLIVDLERPQIIPRGKAPEFMTDELLNLMNRVT